MRGTWLAAAGLAAIGWAGVASAQTAPDTLKTVETDGEVVVTAPNYVPRGSGAATKTDTPLIATPQSVSVITATRSTCLTS